MSTPRTTQVLVEAVLQKDFRLGADLTPFMEIANLVTDRVLSCSKFENVVTISDEELAVIEKWLSAFFYQMSDKGYTSRSTGSASGSFAGQWGMYLESNNYGQAALLADPSGCLWEIANGSQEATGFWLGKYPSEQIPYINKR